MCGVKYGFVCHWLLYATFRWNWIDDLKVLKYSMDHFKCREKVCAACFCLKGRKASFLINQNQELELRKCIPEYDSSNPEYPVGLCNPCRIILNSQKVFWAISYSFTGLKKIPLWSHSWSRLSLKLLLQMSVENDSVGYLDCYSIRTAIRPPRCAAHSNHSELRISPSRTFESEVKSETIFSAN